MNPTQTPFDKALKFLGEFPPVDPALQKELSDPSKLQALWENISVGEDLPLLSIAYFDAVLCHGPIIARRLLCKLLVLKPDSDATALNKALGSVIKEVGEDGLTRAFLALRLRRYAFSPGKELKFQSWADRILALMEFLIHQRPDQARDEPSTEDAESNQGNEEENKAKKPAKPKAPTPRKAASKAKTTAGAS